MLKEDWQVNSFNHRVLSRKKYFFSQKEDANITIDIVAPTEEDAWEKLGKLLGKEDKETVNAEVFEGVVYSCDHYDINYPNIGEPDGHNLIESLMECVGERVRVTVELIEGE